MYPSVDIDKIKTGKTISTEESLKDITPVDWNNDVLNGNY